MPKKFWVQKKWDLAGLVGSVILVAAAVVAIGWTWSQTEPTPEVASLPMAFTPSDITASTPVTEVGNEADGEALRQHYHREDGSLLKTVITYRNQTTGIVTYRLDGTFETFTIIAADGTLLRESTYDVKGELVVAGWEKRADLTLEWDTTTQEDGNILTTSYWEDGKTVFSKRIRNFDTKTVETTYWHQNGVMWVRQLAPADSPDKLLEEDVYNDITGRLAQSYRDNGRGGSDVSFYRSDGSLYFVRHYVLKVSGSPGAGGYSYVNQEATTVYAEDGKTVAMEIKWWWDLNPMNIELIQADGSKIVHSFGYSREIQGVEVFGADGVLKTKSETGADPALFQKLDYDMWGKQAPAFIDMKPVIQKLNLA